MRALVFAVLMLFSLAASAAGPYAQASVVVGVTSCNFSLDGGAKANVPVVSLLCKYDLSGIAVGAHTITVTAVAVADPVWGTQESAPTSPLAFTRPSLPGVPTGLQLTP
jgi:sugar phosphate permease